MKYFAGLDMGSTLCELVVVDQDGQRVHGARVHTNERNLIVLLKQVRRRFKGELNLAIEEGELAHWVAGILRGEVTRLAICDPKQNAWIARDPHKSDTVDAEKLALLLRAGLVSEVYHPQADERMEFKRVVAHYHNVTSTEARLKSQIKSRYRCHGVIVKDDSAYDKDERERHLKQLSSESARAMIVQLYAMLDAAVVEQRNARRLMVAMGRRFPEVALFQEVPGIGPVWSCTFSGYVQTPWRFRTKRRLWRFCRLGITNRSSNGEVLGYQKLDPNGVGMLKHLSFRAFVSAMRHKDNAIANHFAYSLKRTSNATHARLSTQRKILAVLWGMWKRMEHYQPERRKDQDDTKHVVGA